MTALTKLSLAHRGLVALIALIVVGFGGYAIPSLQQELLPSLQFPTVLVTAAYPGASPEVVEQQVTGPIEDAVRTVPGEQQVTSTSRAGAATVQAQFDFGTDLDASVGKLQQAIDRIQARLPTGVQPTVVAGSSDDLPAVVLAATSTLDQRQLAAALQRSVLPELQRVPGVREVTVTGARTPTVTLTVDPARLAAAGLGVTAIADALRSNGAPVPAGTIGAGTQTLPVQVGSPLSTLDDLRNLALTPTGQRGPVAPVRLGDVATVNETTADATSITRTNGKDSLGVALTKSPDGNVVDISRAVRDRLASLGAAAGGDTALAVVFDQGPEVQKSVDDLTTEGLLGLGFAVLVILVFLLSVRSTIVTAVSIPLSVVIALIVLWVGKNSLNLLTLGALTIAIGRVVDDSIVVLENIKRHLGYGEDRRAAVLQGVREVAGAVTASTLTTVAVFLPIAVVGGLVGELFSPFALTVTVALLASLLVSLTVVPVLAYWFLKPPHAGGDADAVRVAAQAKERRSPLQRGYVPVLRFAVRHRVITVLGALAVLAGTVALTPLIKTNFLDDSGQTTLRFTQALPAGSSLSATDAAARQVEAVLADDREIESYQVTVGPAGGLMAFQPGAGSSTATYSLTVRHGTDVNALESGLRARLDALGAGKITMGGRGDLGGNQLSVTVNAVDSDALRQAADLVREAVAGTPNTTDVTSDLVNNQPRVDVTVDRAAAARHGLSPLVIGQAVSQQLGGSRITQLALDGQQQDVLLRTGTAPGDLAALRALTLPSATGPVRLDDVAQVTATAGPATIRHVGGARSATITAAATSQNTGVVNKDLRDRLAALRLPAGASYTIGGVTQQQSSAFGDLGLALLVAIALVFLVMAAVFGSLVQPLILLVSVPFAATGALLALLVTGTPLGLPALIGMLMLVGIVVTNAIVLMDLINKYRAAGMSVTEAVVDGGRRRLRPILMTAAATVFALIPMALGLTGSGGFISQPLAIVVIGGLVSSTLLTLVLVPALYAIVESRRERLRARRLAVPVPDPVPAGPDSVADGPDPVADPLTRYQQAWARAGRDGEGDRPADPQAARALAAWSRRYLGRGGERSR